MPHVFSYVIYINAYTRNKQRPRKFFLCSVYQYVVQGMSIHYLRSQDVANQNNCHYWYSLLWVCTMYDTL